MLQVLTMGEGTKHDALGPASASSSTSSTDSPEGFVAWTRHAGCGPPPSDLALVLARRAGGSALAPRDGGGLVRGGLVRGGGGQVHQPGPQAGRHGVGHGRGRLRVGVGHAARGRGGGGLRGLAGGLGGPGGRLEALRQVDDLALDVGQCLHHVAQRLQHTRHHALSVKHTQIHHHY